MTWRFVNTGLRCGAFNMEYDEYLAARMLEGKSMPTLRVYGWKPFAISIGFHQQDTDIDRGKCSRDGIDVVRRPTGGRAILHGHELTYSVVMFSEGRSIAESHEWISRGLVNALAILGVVAEIAPTGDALSELRAGGGSVSCFASTTRAEIQYRGRKLVGSAQRRYTSAGSDNGSVLLQHGSVLLGADHRRLHEYLSTSTRRLQDVVREILDRKTVEVETILGRPVAFEEAATAIRKGFENGLGIAFGGEERMFRYDEPVMSHS